MFSMILLVILVIMWLGTNMWRIHCMCCECAHLSFVVGVTLYLHGIIWGVCHMVYCCSVGGQHEFAHNFRIQVAWYQYVQIHWCIQCVCVLAWVLLVVNVALHLH